MPFGHRMGVVIHCKMKKFTEILCAAMLAGSLAACTAETTVFGTELIDGDQGIQLTAENADKDSESSSGIDVAEGEHVVVAGNITKGAVTCRIAQEGAEMPAAEWTADGENQEVEYELQPGNYTVSFTAAEKGTAGTVTLTKKVFESAEKPAAEEGQNPIMNFVGSYAKDRALIEVSAADDKDGAKFHITWSSSAAEHSEWDMTGTFDPETLTVTYENAVKKDVVFKEDGSVESETVVYEDGTGSFTFSAEENSLTWKDEKEHIADDTVFGWALAD